MARSFPQPPLVFEIIFRTIVLAPEGTVNKNPRCVQVGLLLVEGISPDVYEPSIFPFLSSIWNLILGLIPLPLQEAFFKMLLNQAENSYVVPGHN
ncbi:hypothetical protein D3C80_728890 [compost metagenome]